jgi:hypothetical protein
LTPEFIRAEGVNLHALVNAIMGNKMPSSSRQTDGSDGSVAFFMDERPFQFTWVVEFDLNDPEVSFGKFEYEYRIVCDQWMIKLKRQIFSERYETLTVWGDTEVMREDMLLMRLHAV